MLTLIHERIDNAKFEFRRDPKCFDASWCRIEMRALQADGTPYDDRWHLADQEWRDCLRNSGSDIIERLTAEHRRMHNLEAA